jgi:hypothetical protein
MNNNEPKIRLIASLLMRRVPILCLCGLCIFQSGCCTRTFVRPGPIPDQLRFDKSEVASRSWSNEDGQQITLLRLEYLSFTNRPALGIATYSINGDSRIRCIDFYRCVPMRELAAPRMELLAHDVSSSGWIDSFHVRTYADEVMIEVLGTDEDKETRSTSSYNYSYSYKKGGRLTPGISVFRW